MDEIMGPVSAMIRERHNECEKVFVSEAKCMKMIDDALSPVWDRLNKMLVMATAIISASTFLGSIVGYIAKGVFK
jgi:hypothetical protein